MTESRRLAWATLAVAALALAWWSVSGPLGGPDREARSQGAASPELSSRQAPAQIEQAVLEGESLGASDPSLGGAVPRAPLSSVQAHRGQVLDSQGRGLTGAILTWWSADTPASPTRERAAQPRGPAERVHRSETDAEGRFEFSSPDGPDPSGPWNVWVTHTGHLGMYRGDVHAEPGQDDATFVLSVHAGLSVQVVDDEGLPVTGATVTTTLGPGPSSRADRDLPPQARLAFHRTASTDADGNAVLPAVAGEQVVIASHGERISAPWRGRAPAAIRLVLGRTFTALGSVHGLQPLGPSSGAEVSVHAWTAGQTRELGRCEVSDSGDWGPMELAAAPADALLVRLDGGDLLVQEVRREPVTPGTTLRVDFEAQPGLPVDILVEDETGAPIAYAAIEVLWPVGQHWIAARTRANAEGRGVVPALREGEVWLRANADGFLRWTSPAQYVTETDRGPFSITLSRAGRIRGRVSGMGVPVDAFRVLHWSRTSPQPTALAVTDSADGSFQIDGAPLGEVVLLATSAGHAPSAPHELLVTLDEVAEIEIELSPPLEGRGRVLDALSSMPLAGARVATWIREGTRWLAATGVEVSTDESGEFSLVGLGPGTNHLRISAEGYAPAGGVVFLEPDQRTDLGVWPLAPAQELVVRLVANDLDPSLCAVRVANRAGPAQAFDPRGEARIPALSAGNWSLVVDLPEGDRVVETVYLVSGQTWVVEIPLDARAHLDVLLKSSTPLPADLEVRAITSRGLDRQNVRLCAVVDGRARIPGPFGHSLTVEIVDSTGTLLAVEHLDAIRIREGRVEIDFPEGRRKLRVVDRLGRPVPQLLVALELDEGASQWTRWEPTDGEGRVSFVVPAQRDLRVHLRGPDGGGVADIVLPYSPLEDEVECVFDPTGTFELRFLDRDHPLKGVTSYLLAPSGYRIATLTQSDPTGNASSGKLGLGTYTLDAMSPGLWPRMVTLELSAPSTAATIQLRRLGSLFLEVRDAHGTPAVGAVVQLENIEFGESLSEWIEQGRVQSPASDLRTNHAGALRIQAVPNGTYRAVITSADGHIVQALLEIPPHAEGRTALTMPER